MTSHASMAALLNVTPQARELYAHLKTVKSGISNIEAQHLYRIAALPRRIADLEQAGFKIRRDRRKDRTGRHYVRYYLAGV